MPKSIPGASRAKISPPQESEQGSQGLEALSLSDFSTSWNEETRVGLCWKTSRGSSLPTAVETSVDSLMKWSPSGMASRGGFLMQGILESRTQDDAYLLSPQETRLSKILDRNAARRFFLTARARAGILRRATKYRRGIRTDLYEALSRPEETTEIRRLTPTECERLMGWPDGWTIAKNWKKKRIFSRFRPASE